ncbi:MAG: efflux RND transporter periplasmic adaptor subunit [Pseudomonadota bacterium]
MNQYQPQIDLESVVGANGGSGDKFHLGRKGWAALVLLAIAAVALFLVTPSLGGPVAAYVTAPASRGDLTVAVTSTGTTQPSNEVIVGIEVSGTISSVMVDFNEEVRAGQVLARLDTSLLAAQVAQSKASLDSATALRTEAEATVVQTEADLARLLALKETTNGALPAAQDLDSARASATRALASRGTADAQISQARAQLASARTELSKATIVSPIDGVVLSRNVDPGQTVAASLQTPELFVLAENLSEMELRVDIDEADVGTVEVGQSATFTVDAYPNQIFEAVIERVHLAPKIEGGVVTYEAVLSVDNSDQHLRPGMTVTAIITTQDVSNALLVPETAFRFTPSAQSGEEERGFVSSLLPRPPSSSVEIADIERGSNKRTIWVLNADDEIAPVEVAIGASDGVSTVILSGDIDEGTRVVIEEATR